MMELKLAPAGLIWFPFSTAGSPAILHPDVHSHKYIIFLTFFGQNIITLQCLHFLASLFKRPKRHPRPSLPSTAVATRTPQVSRLCCTGRVGGWPLCCSLALMGGLRLPGVAMGLITLHWKPWFRHTRCLLPAEI